MGLLMFPNASQFPGGGVGLNRIMGTSGSEATPINNIIEKSGSSGGSFSASAPVTRTPMQPVKPTFPSMSTGSRMGRGMMPSADVRP